MVRIPCIFRAIALLLAAFFNCNQLTARAFPSAMEGQVDVGVYHNPDTGRFWTQDSYEGNGSDPSSLHKYTYCGNNPANCYDPSGNFTLAELGQSTWIGVKVGFLAGGVIGGLDAALHGQSILKGVFGGAIGGAVIGGGFGAIGALPAAIGLIANVSLTAVLTKYGAQAAGESWGEGHYWGSAFRLTLLGVGAASSAGLGARQLTLAMEESYVGGNVLRNLRPPARPLLENEGVLIGDKQGLQSRQQGQFENVQSGPHGDPNTKYLWTIDERGINIAAETTPFATPRGNIVHSNISKSASIGGEAWFTGPSEVTINAGSGRFGFGAGATQQQWNAAISFWKSLGYTVKPITFGQR